MLTGNNKPSGRVLPFRSMVSGHLDREGRAMSVETPPLKAQRSGSKGKDKQGVGFDSLV